MALPLDETISAGQAGHLADHQTIAETLNDLSGTYAPIPTAVYLSAGDLQIAIGAPSTSGLAALSAVWLLDAAATESVATTIPASAFAGWATFNVVARVANATTDAGDFTMSCAYGSIALGATVNNGTSPAYVTTTALAQYLTQEVTLASGLAVPAAGSHFQLRVDRRGAEVADTKAGDLALIGVFLRKAS